MEPIGSYAVRFVWNDGHSSGLYTWETLRRLADEAPLLCLGHDSDSNGSGLRRS